MHSGMTRQVLCMNTCQAPSLSIQLFLNEYRTPNVREPCLDILDVCSNPQSHNHKDSLVNQIFFYEYYHQQQKARFQLQPLLMLCAFDQELNFLDETRRLLPKLTLLVSF